MRLNLALAMGVVAMGTALLSTGCAEHRHYRANDAYYHDSHRWDDRESGYYSQWENENHREHREYRQRKQEEQKEYWKWRHEHQKDHDRDHDHDRDDRK
jgi:hypothetical protein